MMTKADERPEKGNKLEYSSTFIDNSLSSNEKSFQRCLCHIDRVKNVIPKHKITMHEGWRESGYLWKSKPEKRRDGELKPLRYIWNYNLLPDHMRGIRLEIQGAHVKLILTNIQNRRPDQSFGNLLFLGLMRLEKVGIIESGIEAFSQASPEIEIRYDMAIDQSFFDELEPLIVEKKRDSRTGNETWYFTKKTARTRFRLYRKSPVTMRFEVVMRSRGMNKVRGTSKQIVEGLNVRRCLSQRSDLLRIVWPRIRDPKYYEEEDLDFESIFEVSQPRRGNQRMSV